MRHQSLKGYTHHILHLRNENTSLKLETTSNNFSHGKYTARCKAGCEAGCHKHHNPYRPSAAALPPSPCMLLSMTSGGRQPRLIATSRVGPTRGESMVPRGKMPHAPAPHGPLAFGLVICYQSQAALDTRLGGCVVPDPHRTDGGRSVLNTAAAAIAAAIAAHPLSRQGGTARAVSIRELVSSLKQRRTSDTRLGYLQQGEPPLQHA